MGSQLSYASLWSERCDDIPVIFPKHLFLVADFTDWENNKGSDESMLAHILIRGLVINDANP